MITWKKKPKIAVNEKETVYLAFEDDVYIGQISKIGNTRNSWFPLQIRYKDDSPFGHTVIGTFWEPRTIASFENFELRPGDTVGTLNDAKHFFENHLTSVLVQVMY